MRTVASYIFDAYGNTDSENTVYNPFGYRGEYADAESGLIYLRARMYDPSTGRFINEDPIRDGLNWYVYCGGNPVMFVDPWGLFDYDTRLSYSQTYNVDVEVLQSELANRGYLDMSAGGWGYFGPKTQTAVNKYKNNMGLGNTGVDKGVVGLQTWTSLGLTYRTQDDINVGVTIATINRKQYKDISIPINNALNRDKNEFKQNANEFKWFRAQVGDAGKWNVKRSYKESGKWKYTWEETIGSTFPGYESVMILYGRFVTVENIGNITYGYLGKAADFTDFTLYNASSLNDIKNHGMSNQRGEMEDHHWIGVGINWYNSSLR